MEGRSPESGDLPYSGRGVSPGKLAGRDPRSRRPFVLGITDLGKLDVLEVNVYPTDEGTFRFSRGRRSEAPSSERGG